jgi:hypothetical protein
LGAVSLNELQPAVSQTLRRVLISASSVALTPPDSLARFSSTFPIVHILVFDCVDARAYAQLATRWLCSRLRVSHFKVVNPVSVQLSSAENTEEGYAANSNPRVKEHAAEIGRDASLPFIFSPRFHGTPASQLAELILTTCVSSVRKFQM